MTEARTVAERKALIEAARRRIGQLEKVSAIARLPLGCAEMDACLHGGLVIGALHEVAARDHCAHPAALGFLLALARNAIGSRANAIVWPLGKQAGAFGAPYGPGLKAFGIDPAQILFVRCKTREDILWAMEEALRIGGIGAVVGARVARMNLTASRRLQLAAENSGIPAILLRTHKDDATSAAATRWRVSPCGAARDRFGFSANPRWRVTLERVRGGRIGEWVVEWDHEALCLRLPALLGGGAFSADRTRNTA